jgi:DNA-binding response OmpR family regulator
LDPAATRAGDSAGAGDSVLLAEHDPAVADMLARYLARDGLRVRPAATPELALAGLADGTDAVAVLDLTMPGLDPRRVRQALASPVASPVVLLVDSGPRPRGLNRASLNRASLNRGGLGRASAASWLTRPFAPRRLVATVRELISTASPSAVPPAGGLTAAGAVTLDGDRRVAVIEGRDVPLTGKELAILATLLSVRGRPCTRRQLLAATGSRAGERSVDVHVSELRAKLGVPGLIRTVRGAGFAITSGSSLPLSLRPRFRLTLIRPSPHPRELGQTVARSLGAG